MIYLIYTHTKQIGLSQHKPLPGFVGRFMLLKEMAFGDEEGLIPKLQYNALYSSVLLSLLIVKKHHRSYGYAAFFHLAKTEIF